MFITRTQKKNGIQLMQITTTSIVLCTIDSSLCAKLLMNNSYKIAAFINVIGYISQKYSAIYSEESYFITTYFIIILGTGQKQNRKAHPSCS